MEGSPPRCDSVRSLCLYLCLSLSLSLCRSPLVLSSSSSSSSSFGLPSASFFSPLIFGSRKERTERRDGKKCGFASRRRRGSRLRSPEETRERTEHRRRGSRSLAVDMEGSYDSTTCQINPGIGKSSPRATIRRLDPRQSRFARYRRAK